MLPDGGHHLLAVTGEAAQAAAEQDGANILVQILILILLILFNAFFAASEIAIITLNDNMLKKRAGNGYKKAKTLVKLTENPSRFLATIQVGVTLSGFLASAVAATSFADKITAALTGVTTISPGLISAISTIVITLLLSYFTLVFGELVPKRIAMQKPEAIAYAVGGTLKVIASVSKPFIWLLSKSTNAVVMLLGFDPNAQTGSVTEEEIMMMVDVGEERGVIEESARDMINNIFEFDDITAGEIMTHRTEIEAVEDNMPITSVLEIAMEKGYSRIPVFNEALDNILGVIYVKDLLQYVGKAFPEDCPVTSIMRQTLYVPETKKCRELFTELTQKKLHMAVVVDEYGGTAGIVTMEDLLESIVGNIQDEYDNEDEEMIRLEDGAFTIDGTADIDEVSDLLDVSLPEGDYDTIGGLILSILGRIPTGDEHPAVDIAGYTFTVQDVEERRIARIHAGRIKESVQDDKKPEK